MKKRQRKGSADLPSYEVIKAASAGNAEAMDAILNHYGDYIAKLSLRVRYDEYGIPHCYVDEFLRRRLQMALMDVTLGFDPVPYDRGSKAAKV
ncbi:MAG: helix-turn-helix domain-containing protein [Lachnospiraceae bacterium]|nr:helix-turn-helix domain-containing protein [Lachnospiraceae bacterium]